jgi:murein DD-endopeptidase MepM/ murein hydrolase activator NlpD
MKRNRLTLPSSRTSLFTNTSSRPKRRRNIFVLSSFAIAGIFITSMTLATNRPVNISTQSEIINLPNLPAELQNISSINTSQPLPELTTQHTALPVIDAPILLDIPTATAEDETNIVEQTALLPEAIEKLDTTTIVEAAIINWQEVKVKSGDNLSLIFPRVGLSARDVYNVAKLDKEIRPLLNLKPGQILRFDIEEQDGAKILNKLELKLSKIKTFTVTSTEDGYQAQLDTREVEKRQAHASAIINSSLFGAGITAGLSDKLIMELAYIFGWDIDFALDLRQGDHFTVIFSEDYLDGDKISDGDILAAEFTNQGKKFSAIRYTDVTGKSDYFSPTGDSMRKAFSRTPVHFTRISSRFNPMRKHPKLKGVTRPHRGVDYAAKTGTPILATGDGKIDFAGRKGGYGRTVVLSHGGKYTTLYAHMSRYKKGMKRGKRVKQGDVIGYVGMSGTATGPHLHYEFRVHGVHRNPLTVSLPKAQALSKKYRTNFKQKSEPLLAQLDSLQNTAIALKQ